jgi:hypothetical protein
MATTKSTVVGIRLDHERRAWVEAEAARLGVSVRGLFEGMIDEARLGDAVGADRAIAGLGSAAPVAAAGQAVGETVTSLGSGEPTASEPSDNAHARSSLPGATASSPWSGLPSVTSVPGGLIREALSLTASLIELSGRCATNRLGNCVLTRRLSNRSL